MSVPSWNSILVLETLSVTFEVMCLILPMPANAVSTRSVIWDSISVGDAPGKNTDTLTTGIFTFGMPLIGKREKDINPVTTKPKKMTIGTSGRSIAHDEMRKAISLQTLSLL